MNKLTIGVLIVLVLPALTNAEEPVSTPLDLTSVPLSDEAREERLQEEVSVKISVKPAEGEVQSSVPVPFCMQGAGCPEMDKGGRVRFWLVGLDIFKGVTESEDVANDEADGVSLRTGVFFMRRVGHAYYELRNVLSVAFVEKEAEAVDPAFKRRMGVRGSANNGVYYSVTNGDDVVKNPFTMIFGGKATVLTNITGYSNRSHVLSTALQLSTGVLINFEDINFKLTGEMDFLRTAMLHMRENELGPNTESGMRTLTGSPFKGFGVQSTISSGPVTMIVDVGKSDFGGEHKETLWHGSLDVNIHSGQIISNRPDGSYHGFIWNLGVGVTRYGAEAPGEGPFDKNDVRDLALDLNLGLGYKR